MLATNFTNLKNNFKKYCDKINKDSETLIITRKNNDENIVMMSLDDYNNLMENLKVIKNPEYFIELYTSLQEFKKNKTITKSLDELEEMSK